MSAIEQVIASCIVLVGFTQSLPCYIYQMNMPKAKQLKQIIDLGTHAASCGWVLCAQNYGNNKKSDKVANRWMARGVEMLLHK